MPQTYVVKQGDFLAAIAQKFGFPKYETIWNDPRNAKLKQRRKSPAILFPGDILIIPDAANKDEGRATDAGHTFEVPRQTVHLKIRLRDAEDNPIKSAKYILNIHGKSVSSDADGSGLIDEEIPANSHAGTLLVLSDEGSFDVEAGILVGDLNPLDQPSGQMARLNNLGYFAGTTATGEQMDVRKAGQPADISDEQDLQFRSAVEEFQCDHMGPAAVDGICGPQTQAKLKLVYGC
jgi:N-acetylmuramoyl-L-alanine amidase